MGAYHTKSTSMFPSFQLNRHCRNVGVYRGIWNKVCEHRHPTPALIMRIGVCLSFYLVTSDTRSDPLIDIVPVLSHRDVKRQTTCGAHSRYIVYRLETSGANHRWNYYSVSTTGGLPDSGRYPSSICKLHLPLNLESADDSSSA